MAGTLRWFVFLTAVSLSSGRCKDGDEDGSHCSSGKFGVEGVLRFLAYLAVFVLILLLMSLCKLCANETQRFKELRERLERIDRTIISMDIDVDFTEAKDTDPLYGSAIPLTELPHPETSTSPVADQLDTGAEVISHGDEKGTAETRT